LSPCSPFTACDWKRLPFSIVPPLVLKVALLFSPKILIAIAACQHSSLRPSERLYNNPSSPSIDFYLFKMFFRFFHSSVTMPRGVLCTSPSPTNFDEDPPRTSTCLHNLLVRTLPCHQICISLPSLLMPICYPFPRSSLPKSGAASFFYSSAFPFSPAS